MSTTKVDFFDCDQQRKGTGNLSCEIPTGVPTGFFLVDKSWRIDTLTESFNNAYINTKIKEKVFTPFLNAINFTDNSEDPITFTTQIGVKLLARDGKPEFVLDFSKGYSFHSAAWSYNSFGNYDVILTYDNGVVFLAKATEDLPSFAPASSSNVLKGHSAGLVNTGNFAHKDGAESEKTSVMFQLTNPNEYNGDGALLDPVSNGFDIDTINGIVDATLAKISNATTNVVVSVFATANSAIPIQGLLFTDFRGVGTSETVSAAVYDPLTETYDLTFTGDVSGDFTTMQIELFDDILTLDVVEVSNVLYQGISPS